MKSHATNKSDFESQQNPVNAAFPATPTKFFHN
jgi:hypothetical protein